MLLTTSSDSLPSPVVSLQIEGMTCSHCTSRIEEVLGELPFVEAVEQVSLDTHRAILTLREPLSEVMRERLAESVEDAGFDLLDILDDASQDAPAEPHHAPLVEARHGDDERSGDEAALGHLAAPSPPARQLLSSTRIEIDVHGMTCASCVARVEKALDAVPGVREVVVNYATERASIVVDEDRAGDEDALVGVLENAVESAGYEVSSSRVLRPGGRARSAGTPETSSSPSSVAARHQASARAWRRRFLFGLVSLPPILLLQMGPMWFDALASLTTAQALAHHAVVAYLTAMVLLVSGRPFFQGAWSALRHRSANMDTLVALGAGVAFAYSLGVTVKLAI